jgi:hypothetical protein
MKSPFGLITPFSFFSVITLTMLSGTSYAQSTKCNIDITGSPAVRGLKLGMTKDEAEQSFGQTINRYSTNDADDTANMIVSAPEYPEKLNNVFRIAMKLFEGKIYEMDITYGSGNFESMAQAQQLFNQTWKLPNAWSPVKHGSSVMYCNGWGIVMELHGGKPQLELAVTNVFQKVQARRKEKAGAGFKP